ncbi:hypothetical protein ACFE04_010858 [Oxalis oulophora]
MTSAPITRFFSYQRLKNEGGVDDENERVIGRSRTGSFRLRRKRVFRLKVPSLRKLLRKRFGLLVAKVMKRLKESQAHFGDLFAGNYMLLQVNPTPLKHLQQKKFSYQIQGPSYYYSQNIARF